MVLNHIQECNNQLGILYRNDFVHILLNIREQLFTGAFHRRTICNGIYVRKRYYMTGF